VSALQASALAMAGLAAGALNATVGSGGLVSLVALLWTGVPAHTANIANQVGTPTSFVAPASAMLRGRDRSHVVPTVAMCAGTVVGSVVLAHAAGWFRDAAPVLILVAAGAVAVQPLVQRGGGLRGRLKARAEAVYASAASRVAVLPARAPTEVRRVSYHATAYTAAMVACGLYAGVVGAGVGTIALALISYTSGTSLVASVPARNVMCLAASLVAALTLTVAGPVDWALVGVLLPSLLVGGALGVRWMGWFRERDSLFRGMVVAASILAAGWLLWTG
jgi:uncharacterized protein